MRPNPNIKHPCPSCQGWAFFMVSRDPDRDADCTVCDNGERRGEGVMDVFKMGANIPLSAEMCALGEGFQQRGRVEVVPLTDEDRAAHKRAVEAMAELERNPWAFNGYDGYEIEPLETRTRFIPEETTEEWLARWRASKEQS